MLQTFLEPFCRLLLLIQLPLTVTLGNPCFYAALGSTRADMQYLTLVAGAGGDVSIPILPPSMEMVAGAPALCQVICRLSNAPSLAVGRAAGQITCFYCCSLPTLLLIFRVNQEL